MDGSKTIGASSRPAVARTPQPPPPVHTTATGTRRSSAPTAPPTTALAGSRAANSSSSRQPKARHNKNTNNNSNNSSSSPRGRSSGSGRKPAGDEPATDTESVAATDSSEDRFESVQDEWMRQSQLALASMETQVHDAAKRNQKQQQRCAAMQTSLVGKQDRMGTLQGTYSSLTRELLELEALSANHDDGMDSDALDKMYMSLPADQRTLTIDSH